MDKGADIAIAKGRSKGISESVQNSMACRNGKVKTFKEILPLWDKKGRPVN